MAFLTDRKFSFRAGGWPPDTFAVVDFSGEEGLSRPYRFEVLLVTDNTAVDLGRAVQSAATFTIHRESGGDVPYHGILTSFEQLHAVDRFVFYRTVLVPRLWWLSLTHHNQVFLDKTVPEIVEGVLKDGGLTSLDSEFRLKEAYAPLPYVCQYGESHLSFLSRRMEREGIYYHFEQTETGEKVIFTDTAIAHTPSPKGEILHYEPPSGFAGERREETIQGLTARLNSLPRKVLLKDYNYEKPSLEMTGEAIVEERGRGEAYTYGEHFRTPEEGNRLAGIRAQELRCLKMEFLGESTVPYLAPGFTFALKDHFREGFNQTYLTLGMRHEGCQTGFLVAGVQKGLSEREMRVFYRNTFRAIPAAVQFRPPRTAEAPKITGTLSARIDAAGSGSYAELDNQGRYNIILPFDMSGRKNGKASARVRMAAPYAGSGHGIHFPRHKGTEVLLTFIDGDPDRPVIVAALPNPETQSVVTDKNRTMAAVTTAGDNRIHMEDKEGSERILMNAPRQSSYVRIGAHNDPPPSDGHDFTDWGIAKKTDGWWDVEAKGKNEIILGESFDWVTGTKLSLTAGLANETVIGGTLDVHAPESWSWTPFNSNVEMNHLGAEGTQTVTGISNDRMSALEQKVQGEVNEAINSKLDAVASRIAAVGIKATAAGSAITAAGNRLDVNGQKIGVLDQSILATANALETAGNRLKTAGRNLSNDAVLCVRAATTVEGAAERSEAAATSIIRAGVIMEGI
jgi:type VI secretion system secreted protein VgrG